MFSPNGVNNEWDKSIKPWSYALTSTRDISGNLDLLSTKFGTTYPYARSHDHWQTTSDRSTMLFVIYHMF